MNKVIKLKTIPKESTVLNGFTKVDYQDVYQIQLNETINKSIEDITNNIFKLPNWVTTLFKIRNGIVGVFGLKTKKEEGAKHNTFFKVIEKTENEIVMAEEDKHLNFRASVLINKFDNTVCVITLVHFNNIGGRIYFLPVKPFHKIIMKALLKKLNK